MQNIIILLFLLILLVLIYIFNKFNILNKFSILNKKKDIYFYKCNKFVINKTIYDIFKNYNIKRTFDINYKWNLFMPCTYNDVENELKQLNNRKINNRKINRRSIFGIQGCDLLVSKNNMWKLLEDKYNRNNAQKIMPETWILSNNNHMKKFKSEFNANNMYIMKKNIQRKKGLLLTNNLNEIINNEDSKFRIVQKYMKNTFMINRRKINLRIYLLIIIKNNKLHSYFYKNGKCIYTNKDYNNTNDLEENITSLNLDLDIYEKNPFDLFELLNYLGNEKYLKLINNIKFNLKKLEDCYRDILLKLNKNNNTYFQLFGLDYIFDNDFNVYLLELNKGPDMTCKNDKDCLLKYRVYEDLFDKVKLIESNKKNMYEKII